MKPDCFSSLEQWNEWQFLNGMLQAKAGSVCVDCLPEYRDRMCAERRCAHPETIFVIDKSGATIGVNAREKGWHGAVTGAFEGSRKKSRRPVVAMASPLAILEELKRRKA